jgi:hypothetical protein
MGSAFGKRRKNLAKEYETVDAEAQANLKESKEGLSKDRWLELAKAGFGIAGAKGDKSIMETLKDVSIPALDNLKTIAREERGLGAEGTKMKLASIARKEGMSDKEAQHAFAASKILQEGETKVAENETNRAKILAEKLKFDANDRGTMESVVSGAIGKDVIFGENNQIIATSNGKPLKDHEVKLGVKLRSEYLGLMDKYVRSGLTKFDAHAKASEAILKSVGGVPPRQAEDTTPETEADPIRTPPRRVRA